MKHRWPRWTQTLITLSLPLVLLALSLRIVTHRWLIHWEYGKESFPADPYGMTTEERIRLGVVCVDYLISGAEIDLLADLQLDDGQLAFKPRELEHMVDVKGALRGLLWVGAGAGLVVAAGVVVLAARRATRARAPAALLRGSLLGLGLLAAVGLLMLISWNTFFDAFHQLFFASGTWVFPYSDTLIRLFPNRFWIDVAGVVVGLLVLLSVLTGGLSYLWLKSQVSSLES